MPPLAAMGIGLGASAIGGMLGQSAANKGPQSMFPTQLANFLGMFGGGSGTGGYGGPQLGSTAGSTLTSMAATGNPTNVGPAWNAMVNANRQMTQQGLNNLNTQFAGSGARYSSGAMMADSNYLTQSNNNFMNILAQYTMNAQESAAQRSLAASTTGMNMFQQLATMFTNPQGSVAGAGLSSAGSGLQLISLLKSLGKI